MKKIMISLLVLVIASTSSALAEAARQSLSLNAENISGFPGSVAFLKEGGAYQERSKS
jgi:hypothetical protein